MAPLNQRYTLVGFSDELDWRPMDFVEPIPAYRICKACGLVPRVTASLPCLHVLCKKCYDRCRHDDGRCCPLDGERVREDDVEWREFPVDNLLKRKVKCWNEERGCHRVLTASELNKHFCKDCDHHFTSCPKCSILVLCKDVCAHIQSECSNHAVPLTNGSPPTTNSDQTAIMMALNSSINGQVCEMKHRLAQVVNDINAQSECLNQISYCMNSIKGTLLQISRGSKTFENVPSPAADWLSCSEAVRETLIGHGQKLQELAGTIGNSTKTLMEASEDRRRAVEQMKENAANALQEALRKHSAADNEAFNKVYEKVNTMERTLGKQLQDVTRTICSMLEKRVAGIGEALNRQERNSSTPLSIEKELALNTISLKRYEFCVKGLKAKKERAYSQGYCDCPSVNLYISGYHLLPGVYLSKHEGNVLLHVGIQLLKGVIDNFLQWPFEKSIKLTVKHPSNGKHRQFVTKPEDNLLYYGKPEGSSNEGAYLSDKSFPLDDLERKGYVTGDNLHIVWEIVQ
ncbi:TNF receptor-associated factor 6-like isoform X1 [Dermacentor andersoni]|uniref:TNF receptor-associated factor 6-like isoform X1 n=1 Tax=Dermacentor andersoni TaxID=34620 RepID=UPI003B3B72F2